MSSQVSPRNMASESLHSRQNKADTFVVSIPDDANGNQLVLKKLNEIYSPALKLLMLFGAYYGQTNLKHLECMPTSRRGKQIFSKIYCGLMISLLCLDCVMAVSGIFTAGAEFVFLMFALIKLMIVICGITSLAFLPLTTPRRCRFEQYLRRLITNSKGINFNFVRKKSRKGFIVICLLYVLIVTFTVIGDQKLDLDLTCCKPWSEWFGFRVIAQLSTIIGSAVWLLSMYFFYLTCRILVECFDGLYKRMSSLPPLSADFPSLKMEHHKLCEVVELADKMLAPLLLGVVALYIPMLCISFYNSVIFREDLKLMALAADISWCFIAAGVLAIVLFFGSKVSEKVCRENFISVH